MASEPAETPILNVLASMTADAIEASTLDAETLMLVRIAALVATDAPAASYLLNLSVAGETGVDEEQIQGVLTGIAPIVGTSRIVSALTHLIQAYGLKIDLEDLGSLGE
jgi:alkylhydroperoxidase/carboxymuconolactone decarboxylase family protein YurZ